MLLVTIPPDFFITISQNESKLLFSLLFSVFDLIFVTLVFDLSKHTYIYTWMYVYIVDVCIY